MVNVSVSNGHPSAYLETAVTFMYHARAQAHWHGRPGPCGSWAGYEPMPSDPPADRIDIHTHLRAPGPEPDDAELATAERLARRHGIGRRVLLFNLASEPGVRDPEPDAVHRLNTFTLAVMARRPETCIGFCYLNPRHPPDVIHAEMDRCIVAGGMRGIKLWVAVKATDARLDPIMDRAAELGVPVLHHAWYKQTGYVDNESTPADVAELARRHPRTTIIMAHLGGGGVRGVLDVAPTANVLVDTAGSQPEAGLVSCAVRRLGARRVVFGSDWPIRDLGTQVGRVLGARLDPADEALVFYGNAARVLGLTGDDA